MMTGDRRPVALRIGEELGLGPDEIHAEMLPQDKVRQIGELAERGRVAFVGDGVNDAAALARADVGIAMVRPVRMSPFRRPMWPCCRKT